MCYSLNTSISEVTFFMKGRAMNALNCEAAYITTGPQSLLREIEHFRNTNAWKLLDECVPIGTLLHQYTSDRFKLVDAQYRDCDPSISGAFRTTFLSKEHFGERDENLEAEWVTPAIRDYADFPWEAVWVTHEPLFRNDDAGPRVLRIHLISSRLDRKVDLLANA